MPGVGGHKEPLDDVSLAQKVEGEAFRQAGVSKAHVSVNAERGVVYLRGRSTASARSRSSFGQPRPSKASRREEPAPHTDRDD